MPEYKVKITGKYFGLRKTQEQTVDASDNRDVVYAVRRLIDRIEAFGVIIEKADVKLNRRWHAIYDGRLIAGI